MKKRSPYKVALGERANTVLVAIVSRHHIKPEHLLRVMCETELAFAVNDQSLENMYVDHAGVLDRGGDDALHRLYWEDKHPRFDGATVDRREAQEEAPDDVPVYTPPDTVGLRKPGRSCITLDFTPDASAMLVLLTQHDEHASVEEAIRYGLATSCESLFGSLERDGTCRRAFGISE